MPTPSNLYAEKIFSEHPIALWSLDDQADYLSLIDDSDRNVTSWDHLSTVSVTNSESFSPLLNVDTYYVSTTESEIVITSPVVSSVNDFYQEMLTFSIGCYFNSQSSDLLSISLGYQIDSGEVIFQSSDVSVSDAWVFVSKTFDTPVSGDEIRIIIKLEYEDAPSAFNEFLLSGLTLGQWSESFNATSLGVNKQPLPSSMATDLEFGIEASAYGLSESKAYYVVNNNKLCASNIGVPMVYGTPNITRLSPNNNMPSMILPGFGFLNEGGKYKDLTLEMWLKIESGSLEPRKIVGSIASNDGLYVDRSFLTLIIDNNYASYFVGEWGRPMLVHIRYTPKSATVLINGEQVISMPLDPEKISLSTRFKLDESGEPETNTNDERLDQDWIALYSYDDVSPISVDCIAIYSYKVTELVAKRRLVYGQAVESPETVNSSYGGTSIFIDYPFAKYGKNFNYPDIGSWSSGISDNVSVSKNSVSVPSYTLPSVAFSDNKTLSEWLDASIDSVDEEDKAFISFSPGTWENVSGYILFDKLNYMNVETSAISGTFKADALSSDEKILILLEDQLSKDYLSITVINDEIFYKIKTGNYNSVEIGSIAGKVLDLPSMTISSGEAFCVGLDIDEFSSYFGQEVSKLLGSRSRLALYVSGNKTLSNSFDGSLYKMHLMSKRNSKKVQNARLASGNIFFVSSDEEFSVLEAHIGSYTLAPYIYLGRFMLDIDVDSYWENAIPLSHFAKYVRNAANEKIYELDFLQFNVGYPAPGTATNGQYDTEDSYVRTYVSFQYLEIGANAPFTYFTSIHPAPENNVVIPEANLDWITTKYEVVDGTIIYPPDGVNFNDISIVTHIEFKVPQSTIHPTSIKSLQFASQSLNEIIENPVGTRFGSNIYPYTRAGVYFNYKAQNPYVIYKGNSPYLYLTKNSGIRLAGDFDKNVQRGISIPINESLSDLFRIDAIQMALRYPKQEFPQTPTEIFEVQDKTTRLKFYVVATDSSGVRGRVYVVNDKSKEIPTAIAFYLNGRITRELVVGLKEWNIIGVEFSNKLDMTNYQGAIRITGPALVNNISYYQTNTNENSQIFVFRPWAKIDNYDWDYWKPFMWKDLLFFTGTKSYGVSPEDIYNSYVGANKFIVYDDKVFRFKNYQYRAYNDISWQQYIVSPV